jgi:hypothetical protein
MGACPPKANEFPGIKVAARPATGSERGAGSGPQARDGRRPLAMAAPGTSGSATAV